MEKIKYRTLFSGWMPIGAWISDPSLPAEPDSSNYEWELISVNTIAGKGGTSTAGYNNNGSNPGIIFSATPTEPEQFGVIWTWKGSLRVTMMMEKIKLETV